MYNMVVDTTMNKTVDTMETMVELVVELVVDSGYDSDDNKVSGNNVESRISESKIIQLTCTISNVNNNKTRMVTANL